MEGAPQGQALPHFCPLCCGPGSLQVCCLPPPLTSALLFLASVYTCSSSSAPFCGRYSLLLVTLSCLLLAPAAAAVLRTAWSLAEGPPWTVMLACVVAAMCFPLGPPSHPPPDGRTSTDLFRTALQLLLLLSPIVCGVGILRPCRQGFCMHLVHQ